MIRLHTTALAALLLMSSGAVSLWAAPPAAATKSQATMTAAAEANKFCFVLFYKQNDADTQAATKTLSQGITKRADRAGLTYVNVSDPQEAGIVQKFGVSRAPMPMLLSVAPNGAITCIFPKGFVEADLDQAFVTPTMTRCMKAIQDGKLVFLCAQPATAKVLPPAIAAFTSDPQFSQRTAVLTMRIDDPAESRFLNDLKISPTQTTDTTIVLMAPPGVMIGKYPSTTTKAKIAGDLHAKGKCCDDPNCKHQHK